MWNKFFVIFQCRAILKLTYYITYYNILSIFIVIWNGDPSIQKKAFWCSFVYKCLMISITNVGMLNFIYKIAEDSRIEYYYTSNAV